MGYSVDVSGTVRLPERDEQRARELLRERVLAAGQGWLREQDDVTTLDDLASYAAATCSRSGDTLVFSPDELGDPKWSEQATAFWLGLGELTAEGHVRVEGEEGSVWTYTYTPQGVVQRGRNGWDGTGEDVDVPSDVPGPGHARLPDAVAAARRRRRARRYLVWGAVPAAGGAVLLANGEGGLLPLGIGVANLLIGWRLSRPER